MAVEPILEAAAAYARTIPALQHADDETLRDHLPHLLEAISADLRSPQGRAESIEKSHGLGPVGLKQTSAQTHGLMRAQRGLSIEELVAEFRALRSSVLRLWGEACPAGPDTLQDVARFNEAVDQAVAESVHFYARERERLRELFLGIVGHDLRGPLAAIGLTVEVMRATGSAPAAQTALLGRGVKRMTSLLDSLLEFSRSSLGAGMALQRSHVDLAAACAEEVELLRAANAKSDIQFEARGNTEGVFDPSRVREALDNLVSNAANHGVPFEPIGVSVEGDDRFVRISVKNVGHIPVAEIELLFEPLRQRTSAAASAERTHLGLGLFIVRQIARAHTGEATGTCSQGVVCFTIELPRSGPPSDDRA